jgi:hypothetical protein
LHAYLQACAHAGGKPPADIDGFVPWRMSPAQLATMRRAASTVAHDAATHDTTHDTAHDTAHDTS